MNKHLQTLLVLVAAGVAAWFVLGGRLPEVVTPGPTTPPMIVMLHESARGNLPPYALGAANELTAAGRDVRTPDDDDLNGLGEVPAWLKPALVPGRAIMGPEQIDDALILLDGERVVKAVKLPANKAEILEAVK